ncbi:NAD(P)H-dependent oxidoreductase subunit E [bacterium]|nr:NAD(P)H-dependent oxidoreductase subunit E [bacterium]
MSSTIDAVRRAVTKHGRDRGSLLPILQEIVSSQRYLTAELLLDLAGEMKLPPAHVYGVASFYSFLPCRHHGRYVIRICQTISCYMDGKDAVIEAIEDRLKIGLGDTTPDNRFTFLATDCMGWCHMGPAMLINDEIHTELTPDKAVAIIERLP